jgi:trimethylamine-N-oxide reductase (cytochrome c)
LVWNVGITATNNAADILHNTQLIIHWASDVAVKRYRGYRQNYWLNRFKEAGIQQIVIDPYYNDTAAIYGTDWIPILPGTDEALMAAIAYLWISEDLYNPQYVETYTIGFNTFKEYVLGHSDGVPKTPRWAASICDVSEERIRDLAYTWASKPTYVICDYGGANRRYGAAEWTRMLVTMQALLGNIGRPGRGLGMLTYNTKGCNQRSGSLVLPTMMDRYRQSIRHAQFPEAILDPPIQWTTIDATSGRVKEVRYPAKGCSKIRFLAFMSGSGMFLNQVPGTRDHVRALRSPEIEFIYCHAGWWHTAPKFADIILPIRHIGERDDIVDWENFTVYSHTIAEPQGVPKNDLEIFLELATRLGFEKELALGKTSKQWLQAIYESLTIPISFEDFRERGYYKHPLPDDVPHVLTHFSNFYNDPHEHRLRTPSGKIEIYSQRVADFFGEYHPRAPTIPKYLTSPEHADTRYPLYLTSPHPKLGRHSQWRNLSWHRDEHQMRIQGYNPMRINPVDAEARGIYNEDLVKVYNDRGSIICGASVTERIRPGVISVSEGGWYTPSNSMDFGGNPNVLLSRTQPEPVCDGMVNCAYVDVEPWRGS